MNFINLNSQIFSKGKNSDNYTEEKINLNNTADDLTANMLNSSTDELLPSYNYVPDNVDENETKNNFKLTDYTVVREIGKGAEGKIYEKK